MAEGYEPNHPELFYGNYEEILRVSESTTNSVTITVDLSKYRYICISYTTALFFRDSCIYPMGLFKGFQVGYDNLSETNRFYWLKQSYNETTHQLTYIATIPANYVIFVWGIK